MSDVSKILKSARDTFLERGKVYGNAYKKHGAIMAALFPNGIKLETVSDHNRFAAFNAIVAKLSRYSNDFSKGHIDSAHDIINFAAMLEELDHEASKCDV